ncbi:unnamed protein product [Prorocentrum cordatum]|uniref:KIF-binding protein n=1 Tax=Prorocentrum cordatum TaxID=2364126 RepID=A0ABN9WI90_9DINO|nr:unnamed protein product [Polarella glacialis]
MTCADHYMGLLDFERAADKLEEQLVALSDEACPHRGGDLHLDVLLKYGKVLSWDGDAEGAVDAFTAADEVLAERPAEEPGVQRRRAEVWMELAQALRAGGDLDGAERQLSGAVDSLEGLVAGLQIPAEPASGLLDAKARADVLDAASLVGTLREAQAALAQVCVQTRDFARAEQLYVMAFAEEEDWEQPEPQRVGGPPRPAGAACQH